MPDEIKDISMMESGGQCSSVGLKVPGDMVVTAVTPKAQLSISSLEQASPVFILKLDEAINKMPIHSSRWHETIGKIKEIAANLGSSEEKSEFVRYLLNTLLDKSTGRTDSDLAISPGPYIALPYFAKMAAEIDLMATQEVLFQRQSHHNSKLEFDHIARLLRIPEMVSKDSDVRIINGTMQFRYMNKSILIQPPIVEAFKARELILGKSLLLEDKGGNAIGILNPGITGDLSKETYVAKIYHSPTEFTAEAYYGEATSLQDIKDYLDDVEFQKSLQGNRLICEVINLSTLPLFGRVRLRKMLRDERYAPVAAKIIGNVRKEGLSLFQILDDKNLPAVLETIDHIGEEVDVRLARLIVKDVHLINEVIPYVIKGLKTPRIARLLELKVKDQLKEAARLYKEEKAGMATKTDDDEWDDWDTLVYSFDALAKTAIVSTDIASQREFPMMDKLNPRIILKLFEFSGRHPQAKTIFQSFYDYVYAYNILLQRKSPYYGKIQEMKRLFYEGFVQMNENVETTESETDIARTVGLVESWFKEKPRSDKPRMLICGCGNTKRFEGPVIRRLRDKGLEFSDILGVDLKDYKDQIPQDLGMRFLTGDVFSAEKMASEGQFDIVLLPWSMINDIVVKDGLAAALQKLRGLVKKDGIALLDGPVPIGRNSHEPTIGKQADLWGIWGIMEKDFENGPEKIRSIFDIMHTRGLFLDCAHAGFLPDNFSWEFDKQQELCDKVSRDDSFLAANHQARLDLDAKANPIYQVKGYNRLTWALRNYGVEGVRDRIGLTSSLLIASMFGESQFEN